MAQYGYDILIPTEFSAGLGWVGDLNPKWSTGAVSFGLSRAYVRDQWIEPALELGIGGASDEAVCRDEGPLAPPDTCTDGYVVAGPRLRPLRESDRLWRPFVHALLGAYWRGTGLKEDEYGPPDFTLQTGGGIDLRRPRSIHGLRIAADYRRVFADDGGRHQLQVVVSYFLGARGRERGASIKRP